MRPPLARALGGACRRIAAPPTVQTLSSQFRIAKPAFPPPPLQHRLASSSNSPSPATSHITASLDAAHNNDDVAREAAQRAEDLLNLAQSLSRTPMNANAQMRCTIYHPDQPPEATATAPLTKHDISLQFDLRARDLRTVDLESDGTPHILVRQSTILIHMFSLRLLVQADKVAVLHVDSPEDQQDKADRLSKSSEAAVAAPERIHEPAMSVAATIFETKMRATGGKLPANGTTTDSNGSNSTGTMFGNLPYELRVVEAALASVTSAIEAEYLLTRQRAGHVLTQLDSQLLDKDEALIHTEMRELLDLIRKLAGIEQRARAVCAALKEVMDDNRDMADMYLTDKLKGKIHDEGDHQEVEYMLEAYYKASVSVAQGAAGVMANIQRTDETIQSILNVRRNQIMVLDTKIEITMLSFAAATLVAGYIGMNVVNFMEDSKYAFALLVGGSMVGSGWLWWRFIRRLRVILKGRQRS
ncbi:magnesium transporter [Microdochium nivale]|nr:magnesium transporter [Microdochium nivale]